MMGPYGISSILITGSEGHILIDGATEAGAEVIANNIQNLGFAIKDVNILLHSHEHFDHVAGLAKLQQLSGAQLLASLEAEPVLNTGIISDADPQAGTHKPFPPAKVNALVQDGEFVNLAELSVNAISTPGHTYGAFSWQWQACDGQDCVAIVYADSLSPISNDTYHFSEHSDYLQSYRVGLSKVADLDCQILLAPHPSASKMRDKLASPIGLLDTNACKNYAAAVSQRLEKRLQKEQKEK